MSKSKGVIYLHAVFAVKYRQALLTPVILEQLVPFINRVLAKKGCQPQAVNGVDDHLHVFWRHSTNHSVADILQAIKGSSSYFINQHRMTGSRFRWQRGYGVFSVSPSGVARVTRYVQRQQEHHAKTLFLTEIASMNARSGQGGDCYFEPLRDAPEGGDVRAA